MVKFIILLFAVCIINCNCDDFLPNWMGNMFSIIQNQTLLDLSLPGTHDTMTYDLSEIVANGADDGSEALSLILHYASELGITPSEWIRNQSKTQGLDITTQLNNGVRFIDFRIMYTSGDWYSLHFMQSNKKAVSYLTEIRQWIDAHPKEFVVFWLSKHGSPCKTGNDQYPGVSIKEKQDFWSQIQQILGDLLVNSNETPVNTTRLSDLLARNHRVVIYASDYKEFTNSSPYAVDACNVDNTLCNGVENEIADYNCTIEKLSSASQILRKDKSQNKFYLLSMASSATEKELTYSFFAKFVEIDREQSIKDCAASFSIPGMTDWCPPHLQDISQLTNYYNQLPLEAAFKNQWDFPNAIYLDAVDSDGTIRVGTELFPSPNGDYRFTRYAYVSTLLLYNLRKGCGSSQSADCVNISKILEQYRATYPIQRWDDKTHGRLIDWPVK